MGFGRSGAVGAKAVEVKRDGLAFLSLDLFTEGVDHKTTGNVRLFGRLWELPSYGFFSPKGPTAIATLTIPVHVSVILIRHVLSGFEKLR